MAKDFRTPLYEYLDDTALYIEQGGALHSKFDQNYLDYGDGDFDEATTSLFERAKLDPRKPGHWQVLLSFVALAIYSDRTGRKVVWDNEADGKLFRAVLKLRRSSIKSGSTKSVKAICKELKETPAYKKIASAEALHARFNIVIRKKRSEAKGKDAPSALKRDLEYFSSSGLKIK